MPFNTFHSTSIGVEPCPTVDRHVEHQPGAPHDRCAGFDADVDARVVNAACASRRGVDVGDRRVGCFERGVLLGHGRVRPRGLLPRCRRSPRRLARRTCRRRSASTAPSNRPRCMRCSRVSTRATGSGWTGPGRTGRRVSISRSRPPSRCRSCTPSPTPTSAPRSVTRTITPSSPRSDGWNGNACVVRRGAGGIHTAPGDGFVAAGSGIGPAAPATPISIPMCWSRT